VFVEATGSSVYDNKKSLGLEHGRIHQTKGGGGNIGITIHEEHEYVEPPPEVPMGFSSNGYYDNPTQLLGTALCIRLKYAVTSGFYSNITHRSRPARCV